MSDRIIQAADLSRITTALGSLGDGIGRISQQVDTVDNAVAVTRGELADLQQQFKDFEVRYERTTELGLAETRLVKVRQQLEREFGHHGEVRRTATGIMQASDVGVVRQETVKSVTEELMLLAPGYWLAPALVALSAWISDNKPLAETALAEALRRDDGKTSLFFALICRRAVKGVACATWLDRYLGQQDPRSLKRQTMVLIDATAGGVFAADVQLRSYQRFQVWLDDLAERTGFIEEQRRQWRDALTFRIQSTDFAGTYPHLSKRSGTWPQLDTLLNRAALNADLRDYLAGIFENPLPSPARLSDGVDQLLEQLVTEHDARELPLRREEAMLQLIVDEGGRKDAAASKFKLSHQALEEEVSFTQLLTNAAMHAEQSGATRASQRLALALSRDWLRDAHSDITLATRNMVPATTDLVIGNWSSESRDGSEESQLIEELEAHIAAEREVALAAVALEPKHWIGGVIGVLMIASIFSGHALVALIGLAVLGWVFMEYRGLEKRRELVRSAFEARRDGEVATLRVCLAELVEWHRAFAAADALAEDTGAYISAIAADSHLATPHGGGRRLSLDAA